MSLTEQIKRFGADSLLPDWKPPKGVKQVAKMKSGKKAKVMKKILPQTEGYTPKGAMRGGGSTTKASRAREKRLSKVAM